MKECANNYYLCVTEYHILLSILISTEVYQSDMYMNNILLCNSGRFNDKKIYDISGVGNIKYVLLEEKEFVSQDFIKQVCVECTNTLFLFNLNYPHFHYIAYLLRKNNIKTALVQDGLGLYMHQPYTLREKVSKRKWCCQSLKKLHINDFSFFLKCFGLHGLFGSIFQDYDTMAKSSLVSQVWLTEPNQAQYAKNKVKQIPGFSNESIVRAYHFFKYSNEDVSGFNINDFLFVDQRIDGTYDFIRALSERFPSSTIFVKLHPRSPMSWIGDCRKLSNVRIIDSMKGIPLELLILTLSKVIIISAYSAALLMENASCRYYYTYPWFAKKGFGKGEFDARSIFNPTKHIKVINSLDEIVLF